MRQLLEGLGLSRASKEFDVKGLADELEKAYLSKRREPYDKAKRSFSPSNIAYLSGACPRRWFYDFTGGIMREDDIDAVSIANMDHGTAVHGRIQDASERTGLLVEAERELRNEDPPIHAFVDVIINWQGEEVVGEIKTANQESFLSKRHKMKPAGYHLVQLLIYMKILGLRRGFFLYENKSTQQILIIPIEMNEENEDLINSVFDWMRMTHKNWELGNLPTRPFSPKSPACKSCYFQRHCWEDEDGTADLPKLEVPK